jgi:hypothetical protein
MTREDRIERGRQASQALELVDGALDHIRERALATLIDHCDTPEEAWSQRAIVLGIDELRDLLHDYVRTGNNDVKLAEQEQQRGR